MSETSGTSLDRNRVVGGYIYAELLDSIDADADEVMVALTDLLALADSEKARTMIGVALRRHYEMTRKVGRLRDFKQRGKQDGD